jgi:hypothetical protein
MVDIAEGALHLGNPRLIPEGFLKSHRPLQPFDRLSIAPARLVTSPALRCSLAGAALRAWLAFAVGMNYASLVRHD